MEHSRIEGLIAAPFTPFRADGSLNLSLIERQAAVLVANGVRGAFVCGTTGEGQSLSTAERMQVAERWIGVAGSRLRIIVHVGHTSLAECKALAAHAQKSGAGGVACVAPYFFKPASAEVLVQFCAEVAGAAPELPFYYYHIPALTGVNIPVAEFLKTASGRIPNLSGAKFTFENLMDFSQCLRLENGRYDIVFGRDEILLAGLALGARAAIGSTYNFAAPVYHGLLRAFKAADFEAARREQAKAAEMIAVLQKHGGVPAGKAALKLIGLDCGPLRLPLRALNEEQAAALRSDLEKAGFFEFCNTIA